MKDQTVGQEVCDQFYLHSPCMAMQHCICFGFLSAGKDLRNEEYLPHLLQQNAGVLDLQ